MLVPSGWNPLLLEYEFLRHPNETHSNKHVVGSFALSGNGEVEGDESGGHVCEKKWSGLALKLKAGSLSRNPYELIWMRMFKCLALSDVDLDPRVWVVLNSPGMSCSKLTRV